MRLDQRRQPFSFNLAVAVVSAIVVALAGAIGGRLLRVRFLTAAVVPTWIVLALGVGVAVLLAALLLNARRRRKRVFLLIPAFSQKHWFAEFVQNLHHVLDRHGFEMVVHIPAQDFSGPDQARQLQRIVERSDDYDGGFIIAAEPGSIEDELVSFCERFLRPVVFADVRPFANSSRYPANAIFVGFSAEEIGGKAAGFLERQLNSRQRPAVLVVGSDSQRERQLSFAEILANGLPDADIEISSSGRFVRSRAREIVAAYLRNARTARRSVDAIFCTNDEMALGAIDAINSSDGLLTEDTLVVGVDGTEEAVALIQSGGTAFKATIRQDARQEAEVAVGHLLRMLAGRRVQIETFLEPELLPIEAERGLRKVNRTSS